MENAFLPISRADMAARGMGSSATLSMSSATPMWTTPASATPSSAGCWSPTATAWALSASRTGTIPASILALGTPRLGFLVMGGNMDSMVCHYSVAKRRRKMDYYTPGGVMGKRPDYAVTVYCQLIRQQLPGHSDSHRRTGSQPAASEPLRLLVRPDVPLDSGGFRGRPAALRHGREEHCRSAPTRWTAACRCGTSPSSAGPSTAPGS